MIERSQMTPYHKKLYGFDVIVYPSATHFTDAFHLLGCRDMGDKGHYAD